MAAAVSGITSSRGPKARREDVVFNKKTSSNLADLPADLFLKQLLAKGINLSYGSGAD